ncbi:YeeE/YedE family protein [Pseudomonas sp. DTU_2021_1001937_2_SI_NGA_ILE_001]|uniref:YeeE/YedE family protein n=1 Tax=Pseudomonas sp. DTU_2021_1001937_2_SI_NGA_ILE_001 TaxID=3077589 RepID=UPI0028FC24CD|nr:YeeE/YedE family protein [Pseudomonas sp. DTU_2021_1001937_2_SI_NGA_ILE_001]WNW10294.1 YeeE/YedE family protein [Pseudomonas sp. DTU_2021_1001937_2_SI_NGA_ILE_001]
MTFDALAFTPGPALAGGVLIGLGAALFVVANGRVAGISGLLAAVFKRGEPGWGEKLAFLLGLLAAPLLWGWVALPPQPHVTAGPLVLVVAGLLVGLGTRYGSGCTSGHGVCGLSRLSGRSLVATLCFMTSGFATVFILRHVLGGF